MSRAQSIQDLEKKVAPPCQILGHRGVTKGSFGYVSARIPRTDRILIKSKGPDEAALEFGTEKGHYHDSLEGKALARPECPRFGAGRLR